VADDHTVVRDGLTAMISQEPDLAVTGQARDGQAAIELWKTLKPDVTLMDLQMPGIDGVTAIARIRAIDPSARIVVLTTFDGDDDIYRGIRAGARAYLLKDVLREELFSCIRLVHSGGTYYPSGISAKLAERVATEELSPRELEVLKLLVLGRPNKQIASELLISEVTVKSHLQAVFRKLNVLSRTEAIATAVRRGLVRR
jgi:two-component system NarL family response regulator